MPDPQGYPLYELTNLQNNVVFQIWSDGSIVTNTGAEITSGNGSPNGVITAPPGSMYIQKDATPPNMWWQKQTGTDNNGWVVASGGGGVTNPSAPVTSVQFNSGGAFAGDANLEWDSTNKRLQIGGPLVTPAGYITIEDVNASSVFMFAHSTISAQIGLFCHQAAGSAAAPNWNSFKSRGTEAVPLNVLNGNNLVYFNFLGYDGSAYQTGVKISSQANSDWVAGVSNSACLEFFAALPNTTNAIEVARFCNTAGINVFEIDTCMIAGKIFGWGFNVSSNTSPDTGFSRIAGGTVALGNGTQGNTTGNLQLNQITKYNNEATVAPGAAYIRGNTIQKNETGADANVLTVTPAAAAGLYRITVIFSVSAATAATLGWTATWTDSNGIAQAPTNLALNKVGVAAPALTFAAAANDTYCASWDVDVNAAGVNIVVKTTFSGTSIAYKASATIERLA